ncbi:MAG: tetratricopeptide repeat protein [Thermoanaerobaculia bacterium]
MDRSGHPIDESRLLRDAEALVARLRGGSPSLPDRPALAGPFFLEVLERFDDTTIDSLLRSVTASAPVEPSLVGTRIGTLRVDAVLGEGGMGTVYRGHDEKLGRDVAIKTIRFGARRSPHAKLRFRREARLLSRLNHPAVCQVYDLIEREEADYLLLELVEGETLRRWLERAPSFGECLAVALRIVEAVAAAHRAGIVHRDLKPENIMCLPGGGVKVLDFGIARATLAEDELESADDPPAAAEGSVRSRTGEPAVSDSAAATRFRTAAGQFVGTPSYMSPEQRRGETAGAASDIWALGVVLHEIFAGRRPFASGPSPTESRVASNLAIAPTLDRELHRLVTGMLSPEPLERPSLEQVLGALRRISARPARRRRWAAAIALVTLATVGVARYIVDVRNERTEAVRAREESDEVARFLVSIFEVSDPSQSLGERVTARDLLEKGSQRVAELQGRPLVRARLELTLAAVYEALGLADRARPHADNAYEIRTAELGPGALPTLEAASQQASILFAQGHIEASEALSTSTLAALESTAHGKDRDSLRLALLDRRGAARRYLGRLAESEADKRAALLLAEERFGPDSVEAGQAATSLSLDLSEVGNGAEAEQFARRGVAILTRGLSELHPVRLTALNNLAFVLNGVDKNDEAIALLEEVVALSERSEGANHESVGIALDNLALALFRLGRLDEAEIRVRRALEIFESSAEPSQLNIATARNNLGVLARELGRPDEAVVELRKAIASYRAAVGDDAPTLAGSLRSLATVYERQSNFAAAIPLLAEAIAITEHNEGALAKSLAAPLARLARAESETGRLAQAEATARRALTISEATSGPSSEALAPFLDRLATILELRGRQEEARAVRARLAALPDG